jgi:ABC-type polysaccharide/polyol phosphate export permease
MSRFSIIVFDGRVCAQERLLDGYRCDPAVLAGDLNLMVTFVPLAMFATPVFDRVTDLPDPLRVLAYANPLGTVIEMVRAVVLDGVLPPTLAYCGFLVVSLAVCCGGYAVFERYKGILIDVI